MSLQSDPSPPVARRDRGDVSVFVSDCRKDLYGVIHDMRWLESMGFRVWDGANLRRPV